jgi:hypothetical protein
MKEFCWLSFCSICFQFCFQMGNNNSVTTSDILDLFIFDWLVWKAWKIGITKDYKNVYKLGMTIFSVSISTVKYCCTRVYAAKVVRILWWSRLRGQENMIIKDKGIQFNFHLNDEVGKNVLFCSVRLCHRYSSWYATLSLLTQGPHKRTKCVRCNERHDICCRNRKKSIDPNIWGTRVPLDGHYDVLWFSGFFLFLQQMSWRFLQWTHFVRSCGPNLFIIIIIYY